MRDGSLYIFIDADCPPTPEGHTLIQGVAALTRQESGHVKLLEARLNEALQAMYKLAPQAKVRSFHCAEGPL